MGHSLQGYICQIKSNDESIQMAQGTSTDFAGYYILKTLLGDVAYEIHTWVLKYAYPPGGALCGPPLCRTHA